MNDDVQGVTEEKGGDTNCSLSCMYMNSPESRREGMRLLP